MVASFAKPMTENLVKMDKNSALKVIFHKIQLNFL